MAIFNSYVSLPEGNYLSKTTIAGPRLQRPPWQEIPQLFTCGTQGGQQLILVCHDDDDLSFNKWGVNMT